MPPLLQVRKLQNEICTGADLVRAAGSICAAAEPAGPADAIHGRN